jgi:ABC-2 type transport system permease protein
LRTELRNPVTLVLTAVVPLFMAFIFGFADARANDSLPIGVVNHDRSALADALVDQIEGTSELRVREFDTRETLEEAVGRGEIYAGFVVKEGYGDTIEDGGAADVEVIGDRSRGVFIASNAAITLVVDRENQAIGAARRSAAESGASLEATLPDVRREFEATGVDVDRVRASKSSDATGLGRFTAGMLVFFLFYSAVYQSYLLVEDRKRGVVGRMATTHTSDNEIVAGLMLGRFVFQAIQATIVIVSGALIFGIEWGNPLGLAVVVVLFGCVSTGVSVIVGSRRRYLDDAIFARVGVVALFGLIGGCFFSLWLLPDWVRVVGHATPHAWAVDAFNELLSTNAGITGIVPELLALTVLAVLTFVFAVRHMQAAIRG